MKDPKINCSHNEMRAVVNLTAHPRNPNTHSDEQIKLLSKIIQHQGWRNPIVVSKLSGYMVAGHGRLLAAELLGLEQVPIDLQDFETEADELAHLVADNRIAELSEIDRSSLADIISDLDTGDFDLDLTGCTAVMMGDDDLDMESFFEDSDKMPEDKEGKVATCPECYHQFEV